MTRNEQLNGTDREALKERFIAIADRLVQAIPWSAYRDYGFAREAIFTALWDECQSFAMVSQQPEKTADDAPISLSGDARDAWALGYNTAMGEVYGSSKPSETHEGGWRCIQCGTFKEGASIELATALCYCGVGGGRWAAEPLAQSSPVPHEAKPRSFADTLARAERLGCAITGAAPLSGDAPVSPGSSATETVYASVCCLDCGTPVLAGMACPNCGLGEA